MSRFSRLGLLAVLLALATGGAWWLFGPDAPYPSTQPVGALRDTATIHWSSEGVAVVDAQGPLDALSALGYVHGVARGWTVVLWRQTARGRLSRWFGPGVLPIDRHARRLGLARQSRAAYQQMAPRQKRRLRAYAHGLNAALQSAHVQQKDAFVLHDVVPTPWRPWHTLAVERLLAWIATSPLDPPSGAPAPIARFSETDRLLRRWLHLHGWSRSLAWAARPESGTDSARTALFQRHVLGASATPIVQEVRIRRPHAPSVAAGTLPGAPLLPTGTDGNRAWASLLRSPARLDRVAPDTADRRRWYERLTPAGGDEDLLQIQRLDGALLLADPPTPPNTADASTQPSDTTRGAPRGAWVLRWPGLSPVSDVPAWLQRAGFASSRPDSLSFQLFAPDGLEVSASGRWTVLGSPPVVARDSAGRSVVVGQSIWTDQQARTLRARLRLPAALDVEGWTVSDSSAWAAALLPRMVPALDRLSETHPQFQNVATYLRNWDYVYNASSIGATLFDQWMRTYRADLGRLPMPSDTAAYFATYRQHRALLRALDTLRSRFGPDVRRWRWERAVPDRRFFPVWSADSLVQADLSDLRSTQYAPLRRSGRGHPSALSGGPSLADPPATAPSPTAWEGWTTTENGHPLSVRRYHYDPTRFFARSRMQRARPSTVRLSAVPPAHATTLLLPRP